MKDSTNFTQLPALLAELIKLLQIHRRAFRQERPYLRAVAMVFSELFNFSRHTVTQVLLALGIMDEDWSAWYRLFNRARFDEQELSRCMLGETLEHVRPEEPYVTAIDGTTIHRSSLRMPGTSWLIDKRFSAFRPGIHRAQRFLHGAWLTPLEAGYSRAIPLQFLPAFPPKAIAAQDPPRREWEAGLTYLNWLRTRLDEAGRKDQHILALADGAFEVLEMWRGLPERIILVTRTARNRCLYWPPQPDPQPGPGRPPLYGERAPHPADWLHAGLRHWPKAIVLVRGHSIQMTYQCLGPFVRETVPERPVFLIVVKGMHRLVGKKRPHYKHLKPSFFLVSAVQPDGQWTLPLPLQTILEWLWQRWEIEVAHREMKTGLGWVKSNVGIPARPSFRFNGVSGCMPCCSWLVTALGACWVVPLPLLAGGTVQSAGLCSRFGAVFGQNCGEPMNFAPFGLKPATTGGKKKPGWPV